MFRIIIVVDTLKLFDLCLCIKDKIWITEYSKLNQMGG